MLKKIVRLATSLAIYHMMQALALGGKNMRYLHDLISKLNDLVRVISCVCTIAITTCFEMTYFNLFLCLKEFFLIYVNEYLINCYVPQPQSSVCVGDNFNSTCIFTYVVSTEKYLMCIVIMFLRKV